MFGLGVPELVVIFVIALLIFGPKKLPEIGKSIGRAMAELKKSTQDFKDTVESEMKDVKDAADEVKNVGNMQIESPYPGEGGPSADAAPAGGEKNGEDDRRDEERR